MKYFKILGLAAIAAAALMAFAGSASATMLYNSSKHEAATTLGVNAILHAEAESTVTLHPPFGDIECKKSTVQGTVTRAGSATESVKGSITAANLTFKECNATVTTLAGGELEATYTTANDASLKSTGAEVTVEFFGTHCIFKTNGTPIGTLTGSSDAVIAGSTATFDISAKIPRTGGRSGAFCGSEAEWTGSYKVDQPMFLDAASS